MIGLTFEFLEDKFKFLFDDDITWICFKTDSVDWKL